LVPNEEEIMTAEQEKIRQEQLLEQHHIRKLGGGGTKITPSIGELITRQQAQVKKVCGSTLTKQMIRDASETLNRRKMPS
jgi:hypothetical protein